MYLYLTHLCHLAIEPRLAECDLAVDLTSGNGYDTLFLASKLADTSLVVSIDIQEEAILRSQKLIESSNLSKKVSFHQMSHESISSLLSKEDWDKASIFMMNLGYLPGTDKEIITQTSSTSTAINSVLNKCSVGSLLSVLSYRGHTGGLEEFNAVQQIFSKLPSKDFTVIEAGVPNSEREAPVLYLVEKIS